MYARQAIVTLGLAVTGVNLTVSYPAVADESSEEAAVTTAEVGCRETNVPRAVLTSGLDPLVPDRYTLLRTTATASRLTVTTYTCSEVSVDAQPVVGQDKPTTVTIGSATVSHRDGQPLPSNQQQYIVWYGTDNPVLFARLQQTGLPVSLLPRARTTVNSGGATITAVDWAIRGAGLDYDENAEGTEPVAAPQVSTSIWWYAGPKGDLRITYSNLLAASSAAITADFRSNELLSQIVVLPSLLQINGASFAYLRGSWTSQITFA